MTPTNVVFFQGTPGFIPNTLGSSLLSTSKMRTRAKGDFAQLGMIRPVDSRMMRFEVLKAAYGRAEGREAVSAPTLFGQTT